jgi:tartrate dehydratase alpha subunit/fumarate hydratase class I-like protein
MLLVDTGVAIFVVVVGKNVDNVTRKEALLSRFLW